MKKEVDEIYNENAAPLLTVSASPHIKSSDTVRGIMIDVILALIPALAWATFIYGWRALLVTVISVASSVLFEVLFQLICHRRVTVGDCSAAVTGLLLAMCLPASVPYWMPVVGSLFAIVIAKQIFGGIGKNVVNPALAARVFLMLAWPAESSLFTAAGTRLSVAASQADMIASATPLASLKSGTMPDIKTFEMIIGNKGGCLGEVSALFLAIGGLYLLLRGVITWEIPVTYIGTVAAILLLFPQAEGEMLHGMMYAVCSGGLMIGAIFMATDYVTSPVTKWGRVIFGIGCGVLTILIRYFGTYPEGVSFAILIMNLLVWYIERATLPNTFGKVKKKKRGAE